MCGIFALLNNNITFSQKEIDEAFELGKYRGPENKKMEKCDSNTLFGFHRLAINGLDDISNQPISIGLIKIICNGEIYNYKELYDILNVEPETHSDCEVIIHLYKKYGIEQTLRMLDGVFSFILYDYQDNKLNPVVFVARDPYGVRPLYIMEASTNSTVPVPPLNSTRVVHEKIIAFASELKVLSPLLSSSEKKLLCLGITNVTLNNNDTLSIYSENVLPFSIEQFKPGTFSKYSCEFKSNSYWKPVERNKSYYISATTPSIVQRYNSSMIKSIHTRICELLNKAVRKRVVGTSDRPIACLLSGGLDSSLITALVNKYYKGTLETYSIGMKGSEDLVRAREVSEYLNTKHTEVVLSKEEFFEAIPETIKIIESYDTTTVRASVGNYLIGKYIKKHSNAKVIFNGDGSDELTGGYIYFLQSPDDIEFDKECRRLLNNINYFDVLRSDKSISSNGLEPRTPFLDRDFVDYYLTIPITIRNPMSDCSYILNSDTCEKYLLRKAFSICEPELLPEKILWRNKEAFSDGVSGNDGSWFEIIDKELGKLEYEPKTCTNNYMFTLQHTNKPLTREQQYYREIFDDAYPNTANILPYFWMPRYVNAQDSSARTLDIYKGNKIVEKNSKAAKERSVEVL